MLAEHTLTYKEDAVLERVPGGILLYFGSISSILYRIRCAILIAPARRDSVDGLALYPFVLDFRQSYTGGTPPDLPGDVSKQRVARLTQMAT